jgi:putative transcriptional regulator
MIEIKPKKGDLLIAEPSIFGDLSFNRSVVLIADHNKEGSVGFILNKPLGYTIDQLIPDVKANFKIYNGGPVEQDNLYFIHNIPNLIPNSIEIVTGIYWGGDFSLAKTEINEGRISQDNILFFLGYSGWEANQLQEEMNSNSWIVSEKNLEKTIISKANSNLWKEKMMEQGGEYQIWSNAPEDPISN